MEHLGLRKPIGFRSRSETCNNLLLDFAHNNLELPVKVFEITKTAEDEINVPELAMNSLYNFKYGLYRWDHYNKSVTADITIKCGLFGEGITSCASSRYSSYRSEGKRINNRGDWQSNGSKKPMECLNNLLDIGESISVYFYKVKNPVIEVDNIPYVASLPYLEKLMKDYYKKTLLLS